MTKFIFITGGVISSLGKGICAASLASLLKSRGLIVNMLKLDPYLNVDPGTMSPFQHGEVFVTNDGAETDLDLGYYERFTSTAMGKRNNLTSGQVMDKVLKLERKGAYNGNTVQVIPHVTDQIKKHILSVADKADIMVVEIGGTVGDIESLPFLEAIRQLRLELLGSSLIVHLTYLPYIKSAGELKTKPTQHSVKELRSLGLQPDIIICRSDSGISAGERNKIALFTSVAPNCVIDCPDVDTIYRVPLLLHANGLDARVIEKFKLELHDADISSWQQLINKIENMHSEVNIALVGKYISKDSYKSLAEALMLAGIKNNTKVNITQIDAEKISNTDDCKVLSNYDAVVIPGGFGDRGVEGKILSCNFLRKNNIPFLGICLGMQIAIIEYARNELGYVDANSTEFNSATSHPVVSIVEEWINIDGQTKGSNTEMTGGTMRLGSYECELSPNSKVSMMYKQHIIQERHRHRFEVNKKYINELEKHGLVISGLSVNEQLVEIIELPTHPWFVACQFHPEFNTNVFGSHPLFDGFIKQALIKTSK